ncbi:hypothetical protein N9539_01540 [Amylibacter sp.]|nr:hypothetical protein [Amylibacter sp.]
MTYTLTLASYDSKSNNGVPLMKDCLTLVNGHLTEQQKMPTGMMATFSPSM